MKKRNGEPNAGKQVEQWLNQDADNAYLVHDFGTTRRRMMSRISAQGYDPAMCFEIGDLSDSMQDPLEAGRWFLISVRPKKAEHPPEKYVDLLILRFLESCKNDRALVYQRLPRAFKKVPFEDLPEVVRTRLDHIENFSEIAILCEPVITPLNRFFSKLGCFAVIVGILLVFFVFMIGLVQLIGWLG